MSRAPYVPHPAAIVSGLAAQVIAEVLNETLEDHLEGRYPEPAKAPVRAAYDAIRAAAAAWRDDIAMSATGHRGSGGAGRRRGWLDTKTAAEHLGVTQRQVCRHAAAGRLPARKTGGRWLVRLPDQRTEPT